jgi:hypothetical protein
MEFAQTLGKVQIEPFGTLSNPSFWLARFKGQSARDMSDNPEE